MNVFFINLKRKTAPKAPQKFFARAAGARAPISYIYLFFTIYNLYYNIKVGAMTFPGCHFRKFSRYTLSIVLKFFIFLDFKIW